MLYLTSEKGYVVQRQWTLSGEVEPVLLVVIWKRYYMYYNTIYSIKFTFDPIVFVKVF